MLFPVILKLLLEWIELEKFEISDGIFYAGLLSVAVILRTIVGIHSDQMLDRIVIRRRIGVRVSSFIFIFLGFNDTEGFKSSSWSQKIC